MTAALLARGVGKLARFIGWTWFVMLATIVATLDVGGGQYIDGAAINRQIAWAGLVLLLGCCSPLLVRAAKGDDLVPEPEASA